MFCSECGTKNKKDAAFCSECGHKLEKKEVKEDKKKATKKEEVKEEKKETKVEKQPIEKKPMSKNTKILIVVTILLVALGFGGYKIGSDITSPKHVAKEYIKAVVNNDANKLYNYLDAKGDKTFITRKVFKEVLTDTMTEKIKTYEIGEVEKIGTVAEVKFTYITEKSDSKRNGTVKLEKGKGKKYLIFDNWKVTNVNSSSLILEDYTIKVQKGTKLTYAGIKVTDKYLDKKKSDDEYDVYVLPQVFKYETVIKAELPNGIEVEKKVTPSSYYNSITVKLDKNSISKKMEKDILAKSKEILTDVYENAIASKPAEEFTESYKHKGIDLTKVEGNYKELVATLQRSTIQLTSIKFKDLSIYDIDIDDDGNFVVEVKVNYDYAVQYIDYNQELKTSKKNSYSYMKVVLKYEDSKFYLAGLDNLKAYFSRY